MVQMGKVDRIKKAWRDAGEPYCDHSRHDKEYHLGTDTGHYVCLVCGVAWSRGTSVPEPSGSAADTSEP